MLSIALAASATLMEGAPGTRFHHGAIEFRQLCECVCIVAALGPDQPAIDDASRQVIGEISCLRWAYDHVQSSPVQLPRRGRGGANVNPS